MLTWKVELKESLNNMVKEKTVQKKLKDKDKKRSTYYQYYTDIKWGQTQNYDICLNSGTLGIENCVEIICKVAK